MGSVMDVERILCECQLDPLRELVVELERTHAVTVSRPPSVCLTMIPAEDSLEGQKFYLGEALTTECEVLVDQQPGYGLCLGDEPVRTYCMAVLDAMIHNGKPASMEIQAFLRVQQDAVVRQQEQELDLILQTQVDFKLMEEE